MYSYSIKQTPDGGFIMAGIIGNWPGNAPDFCLACLAKLTSNGTPSWLKTYNDTSLSVSYSSYANDVVINKNDFILSPLDGISSI